MPAQAQKLATDLSCGHIDEAMFGVGLKALGVSNDPSSEPMRLAAMNSYAGGIPVRQLTRAITAQLA